VTDVSTAPEPRRKRRLEVLDIDQLRERVTNRGARFWLAKPVIRSGDYGVLGGGWKVGKSWAAVDLAVSVSTGTKWLNHFDNERAGGVLLFASEGDDAKWLNRLDAVARDRGRTLDDLRPNLNISLLAPDLRDPAMLQEIREQLDLIDSPPLVIVDSFYLAAKGSDPSNLFSMAVVLEGIQRVVQDVGATLLITHHDNQTGHGKGPSRWSGAGLQEWARFMCSIFSRKFESSAEGGTEADLGMQWEGEMANHSYIMSRRVQELRPGHAEPTTSTR
jgi:RecA-family ATPase